ncbi:MAG: phosphate ABC transporter substrate-binding protein PstS [Actinobacteria bacterium]|nr:phosphate ABC transporter substrate-binding protein PstS [Actinomycetota bacterium]
MGVLVLAVPAFASAALTGAGSTLVAPLMANWINGFETGTGIGVKYAAVGSGEGIKQIANGTVDFGASDAPMTSEQAAECDGCLTIPWALTATGVGVNVPGVSKVNLSGPVLAEIFMGKITKWNDKKIAALNPKAKLPSLTITPIFRSDGSGDTYAFTNFLSKVSPAWRSQYGFGTSVGFSAGVGAKGNTGVTSSLKTPGAIGYVAAAYLIGAGIHAAAIENTAGNFELPNLTNIEEAASVVRSVRPNSGVSIVAPPKSAPKAYPISTFTYAIVPSNAPQATAVKEFINYALTKGQSFGAALDFAPLPNVVLSAAQKTLGSL